MSIIKISNRGSFSNTYTFLKKYRKHFIQKLEEHAQEGVDVLAAATPVRTGLTAASWHFKVVDDGNLVSVRWYNTNYFHGVPIVVLLYYGHATRGGGFIEGHDYWSEAMKPVYEKITEKAWKEVTG